MADDNEVAVRFTADMQSLSLGLQQANRELTNFSGSVKTASDSVQGSFTGIDDSVKKVAEGTAGLAIAQVAITSFSNSVAAARLASVLSATSIGTSLTSVGSVTAAAFGAVSAASILMTGGLAIAGIEYAKFAQAAMATAANVQAVTTAMSAAGNMAALTSATTQAGFVSTSYEVQQYLVQLQQIPGVSQANAAAIQVMLGSVNNYSKEVNDGLVLYISKIAQSKTAAESLASTLANVFSDPINKGRAFVQSLEGATTAEKLHFDAAARDGSVNQANAAIYDILIGRLRNVMEATTLQTRTQIANAEAFGNSATFVELLTRKLADQNSEIDKNISEFQKRADAIRNQPTTPIQTIETGIKAGDKQSSPDLALADTKRQVSEISAAMDVLRAKMTSGIGTAETEAQLARFGMQLSAAKQKVQALDDQIKGGSEYEIRNRNIQNNALLTHQATVLTYESYIDSDKKALDSANTTEAGRKQAASNLAQHVFALEKEKSAVIAAQAALDAQNATKGSDAELAARKRGIAAQKGLYAEGTTERINLQAQEDAADTAHEAVQNAIARERAQARYNIETNALTQRETIAKEEAQLGNISRTEELAQLLNLNAQKEAAQRRYLTFMRDSYSDDLQQQASFNRQLEELTSQSAIRIAEIHRTVSKEIDQDYKKTFEGIASSAASNLTSMITGQNTLKQAAQGVARDMLSMFIQSQAKRLADFLAGQATELTTHTATETAKTVATTGGVAARTGAETGGLLTGVAEKLSTAMADIGAGVGATIAGVTGSLALALGPAAPAAGAAAGAETEAAAVGALATGGLAIGTWQVPSDMFTKIHKNEMVVPAFDAERFRSNTGGGGAGGITNIHFPGVMDQAAFLHAIKNQSGPIAKMLAKAMNNNPSFRPSY
jgi:hypothetical protein